MRRHESYDLDSIFEIQIDVENLPIKEKEKVVYKEFVLKSERQSEKGDFVQKEELLDMMLKYLTIMLSTEECTIKEKCALRAKMLFIYEKMIWKVLNHSMFYKYSHAEKEDMVQGCLEKCLDKGTDEENKNFGIEYFARFNETKHKNVFAFWTQQIKNNILQYLKEEYYPFLNMKQSCLMSAIMQFDSEWCQKGIDGKRAMLVEGTNVEI